MKDSIKLDDYEAVNLLSALRASGCQDSYPNVDKLPRPNPLQVLNSGDWIGQIIRKLEDRLEIGPGKSVSEFHSSHYGFMCPNRSPREYVENAYRHVKIDEVECERLAKEKLKYIIKFVKDLDAD